MNQNNNDDYSPVSEKTLQELLTFLASHKTPLKIYVRDFILEGHIIPNSETNYFSFFKDTSAAIDVNTIRHSELDCHFTYKNDIFSFKTEGHVVENSIQLSVPSVIFKLQRRENFRVYVTAGTPQSVNLTEAPQYKAQLNNISLSGCQISLVQLPLEKAQIIFQMDSSLKLKIQLFDFVKTMECTIKFVGKSEKEVATLVGLHFNGITSVLAEELLSAILKLDRYNRQ